MSGGHFDYFCYKLADFAEMETDKEIADLCKDLADLLHDEEWWLSCDYDRDDWERSLTRFKEKWFGKGRSDRLRGYIDESLASLRHDLFLLIGEKE